MVQFRAALLAAVGLLISTSLAITTISSAGFIASDNSVSFALNVPQADDNHDLYFSISGPSASSWIAVGMGNKKMGSSLIFMVYSDTTGTNITLSPRIAHGNAEPTYTKDIVVRVLPGSGIANGRMTANAMCINCRSWKGGSVNDTNTQEPFIYAHGPNGDLKSNSGSANIKRHSGYGAFTLDMIKALGSKGVPTAISDTSGTVLLFKKSDHDIAPPFHAALMIGTFVVLMPTGYLLLRVLKSPKWHGINQALSACLALVGVFLGVYIGTLYNRTRSMTSAHQIFGMIITVALIIQFIIGFISHRMYIKTRIPTRLAPVHIWLGRFVIPCGIANGFLGFPLALNYKYNVALGILTVLVVFIICPFLIWRYKHDSNKKKTQFAVSMEGYQAQPWAEERARSDINLGRMDHPPLPSPRIQQFQ